MLSIRIQLVLEGSANAYELYVYASHSRAKCMHMLSCARRNTWVDRSSANAEHTLANCMRMVSINAPSVCVWSAYACEAYAYAQHAHMNSKTLSRRKAANFCGKCKISTKYFIPFLGPILKQKQYLFGSSFSIKECIRMLSIRIRTFFLLKLSMLSGSN